MQDHDARQSDCQRMLKEDNDTLEQLAKDLAEADR
jgi:hypothetical protein